MIIKLDNPKILADAISAVSEIVTEARIKLLDEGLSIVAVDPANIALAILKIPRESFSQYESGSSVWGVSLDDLARILKRATKSSSIIFESDDGQLKISIFDKVKRIFTLSLIEVESEDKDVPQLSFACSVEMDAPTFSQSIEDARIAADSVSFSSGEGFFMVEASGSLSSARSEFSGDEAVISGIGRAKYSLEYISKFLKAAKISDRVVVRFSDNYPLRIDFPGEKVGVGFILAPRVEND